VHFLSCFILKTSFYNYYRSFGSYGRLIGGLAGESFEFFTSGITEVHDVRSNSKARALICEALSNGELISAKIEPEKSKAAGRLSNGLLISHTYSILATENLV